MSNVRYKSRISTTKYATAAYIALKTSDGLGLKPSLMKSRKTG